MKKFCIFAFLLLCCFSICHASGTKYLNDDPNFPMTGGHGDYFEYTDISSIQVVHETDSFYEISVGYASENRNSGISYRTRVFRYFKDGFTRPQFYSPIKDIWIDIPSQNREDVDAFRRTNTSFTAYWSKFHPHRFAMLKLAVHALFGIELMD